MVSAAAGTNSASACCQRRRQTGDGGAHAVLVGTETLDHHDAGAAAGDGLLEGGFDDLAIGTVGHQRGEGFSPLRRGIGDDAVDVVLGREGEQVDAARRDIGVAGEGHDRLAGARATCPAAWTEGAKSGPMISSAPSLRASCVAACAPSAVPRSSLTSKVRSAPGNSASAISAAFFSELPTVAPCPSAVSGRMRPTRTLPLPMVWPVLSAGTESTGCRPSRNRGSLRYHRCRRRERARQSPRTRARETERPGARDETRRDLQSWTKLSDLRPNAGRELIGPGGPRPPSGTVAPTVGLSCQSGMVFSSC
jgi:hypothetical protein